MALNAFLRLVGQKQGQIKGSVTRKDREDSILVHAYSHEILIPHDAVSGQASGKRQHKPILITKDVDKSTPALHTAATTNETLTSFILQFWEPQTLPDAGAGTEIQYYTIKLTNASIASVKSTMPGNLDPALAKFPLQEEWSFTYQKIEWIWIEGGLRSVDDWSPMP